jgi:hypothetical protein
MLAKETGVLKEIFIEIKPGVIIYKPNFKQITEKRKKENYFLMKWRELTKGLE